jgi:hypothetical protein
LPTDDKGLDSTKKEKAMLTLFEVQKEVGEWSRRNFGQQISKANPTLMLNSIAPLLGLLEEYGELMFGLEDDPFGAENDDDGRDAIGDIGVFLMDYTYREGFNMPHNHSELSAVEMANIHFVSESRLLEPVLRICYATLKHHQGIRGFDNVEMYQKKIQLHVAQLLERLDVYCVHKYKCHFIVVLNEVWGSVKKRDWEKNKHTGQV